MKCLIVASTEPYAGKSAISAALLEEASDAGIKTAYFKPLGTMPVDDNGQVTDRDAQYICTIATCRAPAHVVCPVVLTHELMENLLAGRLPDLAERVREAYPVAAGDADLLIVEGPWDFFQGAAFGLDLRRLTDLLCGSVLLVDRPGSRDLPEEALVARGLLGDSFLGVIFNDVPEVRAQRLRDSVAPYMERQGVRVFGVIPHDSKLSSVTAAEVVEALDGTVLAAEDRLDEPIESFMVGAMGQEKALRYFRRRARKAVVTGGDRSDVQLAALETDTRAVVLTGNLPPSSLFLARAEDLGVPMILVGMDTLTAVERMEALFGHVRIHDPSKVARIREMFSAAVDTKSLFEALGL
ncbi:MAG: phosphotransacetylase family protein [Coriobacteriales bacterium]|nr:phosphotransacetylase family protein [Coriobacteriales bacterium]